jgi:hypothetical protein
VLLPFPGWWWWRVKVFSTSRLKPALVSSDIPRTLPPRHGPGLAFLCRLLAAPGWSCLQRRGIILPPSSVPTGELSWFSRRPGNPRCRTDAAPSPSPPSGGLAPSSCHLGCLWRTTDVNSDFTSPPLGQPPRRPRHPQLTVVLLSTLPVKSVLSTLGLRLRKRSSSADMITAGL